MSRTLPLIDRLLSQGRNLHKLQRDHEALAVLGRLTAFRELPADIAEEAQVCLAEIHLRRKRHKSARRHLTAALLYRPDNARYHYLMATTLNNRVKKNHERAAEHYRKSLECDPQQPDCLADFGLLTLRRGLLEDGLQMLRRAAELAPDDPAVLTKVVKGLRLAERFDEAAALLRAARFRQPRDGRFLRLYNDNMFRRLRRQQRVQRDAAVLAEEGPTLLPFIRIAAETTVAGEDTIIRIDPPSAPSGPHSPHRPARRTDWKHG